MNRQFFAPIGSGLGDVIVSLPVLQALINRGYPTYLVANSERQLLLEPCLPRLAGIVPRPDLGSTLKEANDTFYDFRAHPLQTNHIWGSAAFEEQYPGIRINDILKMICTDFGIDADFSSPQSIPCRPRAEFEGHIVLIPGTVTNAKSWPEDYWLQLCHRLMENSNNLVLLGEPRRNSIVAKLIEDGIAWVETARIMDAIAVISSAKLVIAVDTGLMHIAVNQGVKTVVLFERNPIYYRPAANCLPLFAGRCIPDCLREIEEFSQRRNDSEKWCWYQGDFAKCQAPEEKRCMSAISIDDVLKESAATLVQISKPIG